MERLERDVTPCDLQPLATLLVNPLLPPRGRESCRFLERHAGDKEAQLAPEEKEMIPSSQQWEGLPHKGVSSPSLEGFELSWITTSVFKALSDA